MATTGTSLDTIVLDSRLGTPQTSISKSLTSQGEKAHLKLTFTTHDNQASIEYDVEKKPDGTLEFHQGKSTGDSDTQKAIKASLDKKLKAVAKGNQLHDAISKGHFSTVNSLISTGCSAATRNKSGDTPIVAALKLGHTEMVRALVPICTDMQIQEALFVAVAKGLVGLTELFLTRVDVNVRNHLGQTPIMVATRNNRTILAAQLLRRHNANVNIAENTNKEAKLYGETPLHIAAATNNVYLICLFNRYRADLDAQDCEGLTPLVSALIGSQKDRQCNTDAALQLIELGANIEQKTNNSNAPIMTAARYDNVCVCRALIQKGAELDGRDSEGRTVLMRAATFKAPNVCRVLVQQRAVVELINETTPVVEVGGKTTGGDTALHLAVKKHQLSIVQYLLTANPKILKNAEECTPIAIAFDCENSAILVQLLNYALLHNSSDFLTKKCQGQQTLLNLMKTNDLKTSLVVKYAEKYWKELCGTEQPRLESKPEVEKIIEQQQGDKTLAHKLREQKGVNYHSVSKERGAEVDATLLYEYAYKGNVDECTKLLEKGASANKGTLSGMTPLKVAIIGKHLAVAETLIAHQADVNLSDHIDDQSYPPLTNAAAYNDTRMIRLLFDHNVNPNDITAKGVTALNLACKKRYNAAAFTLSTNKNVDVNLADRQGRTPLMAACKTGMEAVVQSLTSRTLHPDLELNAVDVDGNSALTEAIASGNEAIVIQLLQNKRMVFGYTRSHSPLGHAAIAGQTEIVRQMIDYLRVTDQMSFLMNKDLSGRTVVELARRHGKVETQAVLEAAVAEEELRARQEEIEQDGGFTVIDDDAVDTTPETDISSAKPKKTTKSKPVAIPKPKTSKPSTKPTDTIRPELNITSAESKPEDINTQEITDPKNELFQL